MQGPAAAGRISDAGLFVVFVPPSPRPANTMLDPLDHGSARTANVLATRPLAAHDLDQILDLSCNFSLSSGLKLGFARKACRRLRRDP